MSKDTVLLIGVDSENEKDCQCATLNLYYNGIDHIIYQTTDKEQVAALNEIMEEVMKEKTELQRLESIYNASPNKALELINNIREHSHSLTMINYLAMNSDLDVIQETIVKAQEQEKVLEIIKNKNVDIKGLIESTNVEEYNRKYGTYERAIYCRNLGTPYCNKDLGVKGWIGCNKTKLTQKEFDLLKRYFNEKNL